MEKRIATAIEEHIAANAEGQAGVGIFASESDAGFPVRNTVPEKRLSLAIVILPAERSLLSALRDQWAERVLVYRDEGSSEPEFLTEMGFTLIDRIHTVQLWEFDIASYKKTPDWLNSKGWANPQNWDKYRW